MPHIRLLLLAVVALASGLSALAADEELPTIPVGLDAYRQWDKWPQHRVGVRAYMRSTYDRTGGNEGADASHFLYQKSDDFNVSLDVEGAGILYFARYNHWHGSPWHYVVDGTDHIVKESSTADPAKPVEGSRFLPRGAFPQPLAWTWSDTKGADLSWVPIGFERSFQMAYSRTRYGTGYYIYHQFVGGVPLSRPVQAWNEEGVAADVLELIGRSGTDLTPNRGQILTEKDISGTLRSALTWELPDGPSQIRAIEFSAPREHIGDLSKLRVVATWDGRPQPSVDAPLPLFFGAGTLYNRDSREYLVKAFPVNIRFDAQRVYFACYFPMTYAKSARIQLVAPNDEAFIPDIKARIRYERLEASMEEVAYFHATYRDHGTPTPGKDLVLLDTRETEGGGDWAGHFIGTSWIFSHEANLGTLEGDPRFYFDDSLTPQAQGTGTEEWGGGGDYWGGRNMTLPFAGHPCGARNAKEAKDPLDKIESAYRFLLADLMPFGKNARITLEHGGTNESKEHYETVTYWYGSPGTTLVKTDELVIGDPESERSHIYASPDASKPYEVTSRYEWGVDTLNGKEIYPAHTQFARKTTGESEFTVKLDPANHGLLLRRTLDYALPNQRAEVFIADASDSAAAPDWKPAGIWYTAGSNTCVYSNPKEELGATVHEPQTSNRRFRDDEFLVPRDLTRGRKAVRVRVKFTAVQIPLFPGKPIGEVAWTEMKYSVYCFMAPHGLRS
jgi:hypothetical protein